MGIEVQRKKYSKKRKKKYKKGCFFFFFNDNLSDINPETDPCHVENKTEKLKLPPEVKN